MNWEAIGAVGEIVGAMAVVLSLVYLAVQVRQNTQMLRRSSTAEAVRGFREWNGRLMDSPATNRIFRKGIEGMENLDEDGRGQFAAMMFTLFKTYEDLHYQYHHGFMDPEVWAGYEFFGANFLTGPGCRQYWEQRRASFSKAFQGWVESLKATEDFQRTAQLADRSHTPDTPRPSGDA